MRPGCFVALIEFLNKFAVSHHAVTASPFCTTRSVSATGASLAIAIISAGSIRLWTAMTKGVSSLTETGSPLFRILERKRLQFGAFEDYH